MQTQLSLRSGALLLIAAGALAPLLSSAAGAPPAVESLDPYVLTATRTPTDPGQLGSAVHTLTAEALADRQISTLAEALGVIPGAPLFSSGAPGAITSLFLRGANSNQTLFLVDGIRFSDPNTDYQVFLGGARLGAGDVLEIAQGPQSTLYGGEAVGGVISLRARTGSGTPGGRASFEAGSFGSVRASLSSEGSRAGWQHAVSIDGSRTDNQRSNNGFDSGNLVVRIDRRINSRISVGSTVRGFQGTYGSPGSRFANDPDNEERETNWLATAFIDLAPARGWSSHLVLGGQWRRFVAITPEAGAPTQTAVVENRRGVLDWQATFDRLERHRFLAGVTAEANDTRNTGFGSIDERQTLLAVFLQDEFTLTERVHLTAGLRSDDHDTFGRATTGRVTAAWMVWRDRLKFRASHGTAFRSPSFLDLYGQSPFYHGNPDLVPERATAWDAGFDYQFSHGRGSIGLTWFDTRFRNLISSSADFTTVENTQRARTRGAELVVRGELPGGLSVQAAYTYLQAENLTTGERLLRRPRHSASLGAQRDFGRRIRAGFGVSWVAGRQDVDAQSFAVIEGEDYVVARVHAAYRVDDRLRLHARIENLFDTIHEPVHGFPQPGVGGYAGAEWTW